MALLKDTLIQGSARVTDTLYTNNININDILSTKKLVISSTTAEEHIQFSRTDNINYILFPNNANTGIGVGYTVGVAYCPLIVQKFSVYPGTTNTISLGTSNYRWTGFYSNTGNFSGTVTADRLSTNIFLDFRRSDGPSYIMIPDGKDLIINNGSSNGSAYADLQIGKTGITNAYAGSLGSSTYPWGNVYNKGYNYHYASNSQYVSTVYANEAQTTVGEFYYDIGHKTNISKGQFGLIEWAPKSTADTGTSGHYERYLFPAATAGLTEDKSYNIITTKNLSNITSVGTLDNDLTIQKSTPVLKLLEINSSSTSIILERKNDSNNTLSSWKWINASGTLTLQNNWTSGTYFDVVKYNHTTGNVEIKSTTAATSKTTGALVVSGGIGTSAASYLQGSVRILGSAGSDPLLVRGISGCNTEGVRGTGVNELEQGLYLNINGGPIVMGYGDATAGNIVNIVYTQDASSPTTGALRVSGGAGISKKLYIGGSTVTTSTTKGSAQLQICDSSDAPAVGIELRRGSLSSTTNGRASWQIINSANLIFRTDYTTNAASQTTTYSNEVLKLSYNPQAITVTGSGSFSGSVTATEGFIGNASSATTASNLTNFKVTTTTNLGIDAPGTNAIGYVSGLTQAAWNYQQVEGSLYTQFYNANWISEIFQDYRTGQLSVRGKNNGTWQSWRRIVDETNGRTILDITNVSNNTVLNNSSGTIGDIIYWSDANTPARLAKGTAGKFLKMGNNNVPIWGDGSEVTLNGTATTTPSFYAPADSGTVNYLLKSGGANAAPIWDTNVSVTAGGMLSATQVKAPNGFWVNDNYQKGNTTQRVKEALICVDSNNLNYGSVMYEYNASSAISRFGLYTYANIANNTTTNTYFTLEITDDGETKRTQTDAKIYGAVWNDYAEYRKQLYEIEPGRVVRDLNSGHVVLTEERLIPGAQVVSDTFGFAIGETKECKTPLAVSGRVLVFTTQDRNKYNAGDAVCSGPHGTVDIMTREEIQKYPDAIVGIVSEIPTYDTWGQNEVAVQGRIWIKVR